MILKGLSVSLYHKNPLVLKSMYICKQLDFSENSKRYVIPEDWEPSMLLNKDADEIIDVMLKLDKEAFYRMAEAAGIDLDLLKRAGYEYQGPSHMALSEMRWFADEHPELYKIVSVKEGYDVDFQFVFQCFEAGGYHMVKDEDDIFRDPIEIELMRMFIDEFRDEHTEARLELLDKYGTVMQSCLPYRQLVGARRDLSSWFSSSKPTPSGFDPEIARKFVSATMENNGYMKELLSLYRLLKGGGEFAIQSTSVTNRKVKISAGATSLLAEMIIKTMPYVDTYEVAHVDLSRYSSTKRTEEDLYKMCRRLVDLTLDSHNLFNDVGLFYYAADSVMPKTENQSYTEHYVFLYRLAIFFKYIEPTVYDDFSDAYDRKRIAGSVSSQISRIKSKDKDKSLLQKLLKR